MQVQINSSRPPHLAQAFAGKRVEEALRLLPVLFHVCGVAQQWAGVRACEAALGIEPAAATEAVRQRLVAMETLREHLWRILLDWPAFTGDRADPIAMKQVIDFQRSYQHTLCVQHNPFLPGIEIPPVEAPPDAQQQRQLEEIVFAMPAAQWLSIETESALVSWAETAPTPAARMVQQIMHIGWSSSGRCRVPPLPQLDAVMLKAKMEDPDFISKPVWEGVRETSPLNRTQTPLVEALRRHHGNGLLVRIVARLAELAQLFVTLRLDTVAAPAPAGQTADGWGCAQVEAARGRLVHGVETEAGYISSYRILAPTEWNFHPQGVVTQALGSLQGSDDNLERQARLLINAIDPCVGYELRLS